MASPGGIRAGKGYVEVGTYDDPLARGLNAAKKKLAAFGAAIKHIGLQIAVSSAGIIAPILAAAASFAKAGSELNDMSERTGVSTDALQELSFAARQSGGSVESLEKGLGAMARVLYEAANGGKEANEALGAVGLSIQKLKGLSPDQQFATIAKALNGVTDATARAALAQKLLGKGGRELIPMMKELPELRQQWRDLGIAMSSQDVKAADKLGDTWDALKDVLHSVVNLIGAAVAPILTDLAQRAQTLIGRVGKFINQNRQIVVSVLKFAAVMGALGFSLVIVGSAIIGISKAVGLLATAWGLFTGTLGIVKAALLALISPIGLVVAAVVGVATYLIYASGAGGQALDWLGKKFGELKDIATDTFGGIADALASGDIALAGKVAIAGLTLAWLQGTKEIRTAWAEMVFGMEALWVQFSSTISQVWANIWSGLKMSFEVVTSWVAKRINDIHGLIDSSFDSDAANRIVDDNSDRELLDMEKDRQAKIDAIRKDEADSLTQIGDALNDREQKARDELRAAQDQLKALRQQAAAARAATKDLELPGRPDFKLPDIGDVVKKISAAGAFNLSAAFGLAGGPFSNMEKKQDETIRVLKDIRSNTEDGLTFA